MAGPGASILLREPLADRQLSSIRATIAEAATEVEGNEFRIAGRPFIVWFGDDIDHKILGQLCLRFARMFDTVVDFGGKVLPEPSLDGPTLVPPVRVEGPGALGGVLYATCCVAHNGRCYTAQYGDARFMEAWLHHPRFRMVK